MALIDDEALQLGEPDAVRVRHVLKGLTVVQTVAPRVAVSRADLLDQPGTVCGRGSTLPPAAHLARSG